MSKNTIEQQVAELTNEQRLTVMSIGKKYRLSLLPAIFISIIAVIVSVCFLAESKDISESIESYQYLRELSMEDLNFTKAFEYSETIDELFDKKDECSKAATTTLIIGGITGIVYIIGTILFFKTKYPYFTEGKYEYLKKLEKAKKN